MNDAVSIVLLILAVAAAGLLYAERSAHQDTRAELDGLKFALAAARAKITEDALEISRLSGAEKDARYAESHKAETEAAVAIATAKAEHPDELDPDGHLPLSLTDPQFVQRERICAGGACGYAKSPTVRAKAHAGAQGQKGAAQNTTPAGQGN